MVFIIEIKNMKFTFIFFLITFFSLVKAFPQLNYYEDSFRGGVTTGGYSPDYFSGGIGNFTVNIAPGSTIHKAFLFAGRLGNCTPTTVTLNGISYTFNLSNQVTSFNSFDYGGASGVHAIDVTSDINPLVSNYTINIPSMSGPSNRYNDFYLYIAFDNNTLNTVNTAIFLNTSDFDSLMFFNINIANPVKKSSDIGLSLFTGYICDTIKDGEEIYVNSNYLGMIGGNDINSGSCGGPIGSFYYHDCTLTGLNDDHSNNEVRGSDALANINSILPDNANSFNIKFAHQSPPPNSQDNSIWGVVLAYCNEPIPPSNLVVPNVFTPNGDGYNDVFKVDYRNIKSFNCIIFNRWGKKIYEYSDISKGWNGIDHGTIASDGVYFYIIKATGSDNIDYNIHGYITLIK